MLAVGSVRSHQRPAGARTRRPLAAAPAAASARATCHQVLSGRKPPAGGEPLKFWALPPPTQQRPPESSIHLKTPRSPPLTHSCPSARLPPVSRTEHPAALSPKPPRQSRRPALHAPCPPHQAYQAAHSPREQISHTQNGNRNVLPRLASIFLAPSLTTPPSTPSAYTVGSPCSQKNAHPTTWKKQHCSRMQVCAPYHKVLVAGWFSAWATFSNTL